MVANIAAIKITNWGIPSRKFKKIVKNTLTVDVMQVALKIRASKEKPGGSPTTFAQNDHIIYFFV